MLLMILLLLNFGFGVSGYSEPVPPKKEEWKTLNSSRGYQLRYPKAWKFKLGHDTEGNSVETATFIESEPFADFDKDSGKVNFEGFSVEVFPPYASLKEAEERQAAIRQGPPGEQVVVAKEVKEGNFNAFYQIEYLDNGELRWNKRLFCGLRVIQANAMTTVNSPAPKALVERIKKTRELEIPSHVKDALKSLSCLKPK